jgi:hypothetical protein
MNYLRENKNLVSILESLEEEDFNEYFEEILEQLFCEVIMED